MAAIGIDLGTAKACVSVFRNGEVEIIENDHGNRLTASYVAFTKTEILIGDSAKNQASLNPENTIFNFKRFIGRRLNDEDIEKGMWSNPFQIVDENDHPKVQVTYKGNVEIFTPEEISALILRKMKDVAENYLKCTVTDAVVTVPACFSDSQRQATKDAGKIAGLNILRILNEPTAVALAYGHRNNIQGKRNILVYDLGGGYSDASIISISKDSLEVKATSGNPHHGGEDFNKCLLNHFLQEIQRTWGVDISSNKQAVVRLKKEAERVKRVLSSGPLATIEIDSLHEGKDFETDVSREKFEELCSDLLQQVLLPVEKVLKYAGMDQSAIDDVVLVGGSSRVPKIQSLIQTFFNGKLLTMNMNAEEATAYGAAILADDLSDGKKLHVNDVTPYNLEANHHKLGLMKIAEANKLIPFEYSFVYEGDESKFNFWVSEQESTSIKKCLGQFKISRYSGLFSNYPLLIILHINEDGILSVTAEDISTRSTNFITTESHKGRLSNQELNRMKGNAKHYQDEEKQIKKCVAARSELEHNVYNLKRNVFSLNLNESEKLIFLSRCDETIRWLDSNNLMTVNEYEDAGSKLKNFAASIKETRAKRDENTKTSTKQGSERYNCIPHKLETPLISAEEVKFKKNQEEIRKCEKLRGFLLECAINLKNDIRNSGAMLSNDGVQELKYCYTLIAWINQPPLQNLAEYINALQGLRKMEQKLLEMKIENEKEKENLKNYVLTLINKSGAAKIKANVKSDIKIRCNETILWLKNNRSIEEMQQKKSELETWYISITKKESLSLLQRAFNWFFRTR